MNNLFEIKNKVVLLTGSTGILASSLAKYLASQGATLVLLARNLEKIKPLLNEVKTLSADSIACVCDVQDRLSLENARSEIMNTFARIDVLINAAGGNMPGAVVPPDKSFFDLDFDQWQSVIDLNLGGTLLPILVFAKVFEEQKRGVILNFSSMAAQSAVITRVLGYSNAKASVDNLTKWLAVEFAKKIGEGVRVNAIAPGFFLSEQNRTLLTNSDGSYTARGQAVITKTPFARFGSADEINGAVHYLISEASKFVTGVVLPIDGGFSSFSGV